MRHVIELAVVIAANVLGAAMSFPQVARLWRTRSVDGVSAGWAVMSIVNNAWWTAYSIASKNWALLPVSSLSFVGYSAVLVALVRFHPDRRALMSVASGSLAVGVAAIPAAALVTRDWLAVGVVLGVLYGAQLMPAVVTVYRSDDVTGVSAPTWVMAMVEAALWLAYGLATSERAIVVFSVAGLIPATAVLAAVARAWWQAQAATVVAA
jgi:uncharacterized protein with PQ loop repeat